MKESVPNLFAYATSELSQDAFICWLAEWADPKNREHDDNLHKCGTLLIQSFFEKFEDRPKPEIEKVEIKKQDRHIDVLIVVNDKYVIIVEDKTSTSHHGEQLNNYRNEVLERDYQEKHVFPIYFKTHDQHSYKDVEQLGFKPFTRSDILQLLRPFAKLENAILRDYLSCLEAHEARVQSFKTLPLNQWDYWSWIGFYLELGKRIPDKEFWWGRVNNQSKPFWGFAWNWVSIAGYLIEEEKLTIKIKEEDRSKQSQTRNQWHKAAMSVAQRMGAQLKRPKRFGKGKHMTVAEFDCEYRKVGTYDLIDMDATVEWLVQLQPLLLSIADEANR